MSFARRMVLRAVGDWHYGRWLRQRHFRREICSLSVDLTHGRTLDVGCGRGAASIWLARQFPHLHVTGLDINGADIAFCQSEVQRLGLTNADFECRSVLELAATGSYDLVFSTVVLSEVDQDAAALQRMVGALRPGGLLLLDEIERTLGASQTFGLRRFDRQARQLPAKTVRPGYTLSELQDLLPAAGVQVIGWRYTMAPPALFAHTVFEVLRGHHRKTYIALLPVLRLIGLTDFLREWRRGGGITIWGRRLPRGE